MLQPRVLVLSLLIPMNANAQETVDFSGQVWETGGDVVVERFMGREAMRMGNGSARLVGESFENGTIEFDVNAAGHRSFFGVAMRVNEERNGYEHFYLRPHQRDRFDAVQYVPVTNGVSTWQLYPEYNANVEIPSDRWMHVKLVLDGVGMDVYVDGVEEPTLSVLLRRGTVRGDIGLTSSVPAGREGLRPSAFSNFVVRPGVTGGGDVGVTPPPLTDQRFVRSWSLSPSLEVEDPTQLPPDVMEGDGWTDAGVDEKGRLNISEHRMLPPGGNGTVFARVVVDSDGDQVKALNFGFSDRVTVFLNGGLVYRGDNTYLSRSGRYLGVMTLENDAVHLPLRGGRNEIVFAVSEAFGGWGLTARWADLSGIEMVR